MANPYDLFKGISSVQKNLPAIKKKIGEFMQAPAKTVQQAMPSVQSFLKEAQAKQVKLKPVATEPTSYLPPVQTKEPAFKLKDTSYITKPVGDFLKGYADQRSKDLESIGTKIGGYAEGASNFLEGMKQPEIVQKLKVPKYGGGFEEIDSSFATSPSAAIRSAENKMVEVAQGGLAAIHMLSSGLKSASKGDVVDTAANLFFAAGTATPYGALFAGVMNTPEVKPIFEGALNGARSLWEKGVSYLGVREKINNNPNIPDKLKKEANDAITLAPDFILFEAVKKAGAKAFTRESTIGKELEKTPVDSKNGLKRLDPRTKVTVYREWAKSLMDEVENLKKQFEANPINFLSERFPGAGSIKDFYDDVPSGKKKTGADLKKEKLAKETAKLNEKIQKAEAKNKPTEKLAKKLIENEAKQVGIKKIGEVPKFSRAELNTGKRLYDQYKWDNQTKGKAFAEENKSRLKPEERRLLDLYTIKKGIAESRPLAQKPAELPKVSELQAKLSKLSPEEQAVFSEVQRNLALEKPSTKKPKSLKQSLIPPGEFTSVKLSPEVMKEYQRLQDANPRDKSIADSYLKAERAKLTAQPLQPVKVPTTKTVQAAQEVFGAEALPTVKPIKATPKPVQPIKAVAPIEPVKALPKTVADIAADMNATAKTPEKKAQNAKKIKRVKELLDSNIEEAQATNKEVAETHPEELKTTLRNDIKEVSDAMNIVDKETDVPDPDRLNKMDAMVEEAISNPQAWVDYARAEPKWWQRIIEDAKNSGGVINYLVNLGHEYLPYIKNKEYLKAKTDYIRHSKSTIEQPIHLFRKMFTDNTSPKSLKTALFDVWWRTMARRLKEGKDIPFGLNEAEVMQLLNKNKIDLNADKQAQRIVKQYDKNRIKMLDDMEASGYTISDKMRNDPDYFPIRIVDDFVDRISNSTTYRQKENPSFTKTQTGSTRAANLNLPQVVLDMYVEAYKSMPLKSFMKNVIENFVRKDINGKPLRPTSKESIGPGDVAYQLNPLQFFKIEGLTEQGFSKMMEDQSMDFGEYANQILSTGKAPWFIMPKEVAEDISRMAKANPKVNEAFRQATKIFKSTAIMSKVTSYMMRNMFSDIMAASAFSKNTPRFIKYYAQAWADLSAYYTTGVETPFVKELKSVGGLQAGFVSESFKNPILDVPEMARARKLLFGETAATSYINLVVKRIMSVQEVAGRIALAKDLGDGTVTMDSFKEANKLMVDYDGASTARRALETAAPFKMWVTGMAQSLLGSLTGKTTFLEMTKGEKAKRALKVVGTLGAYALWRYQMNHKDQDGLNREETALNAIKVPTTEWTADQITDSIEYAKDIGVTPSQMYLPSSSSYTVIKGNDGKPLINERGEVLLLMLDSPSSSVDLVFDSARAIKHGYGRQFLVQQFNPVATGFADIAANTNIQSGQPINQPGTPAMTAIGNDLAYYVNKNIGPVRVISNIYRNITDGKLKTYDDVKRAAALQFLPVYSVDLNKLKKNIGTARISGGEAPAIYAEQQKADDLYQKSKSTFIAPVKKLILNRFDQMGLITNRYQYERAPYIPGRSEQDAKQAFDFLRSQPITDQVKIVQSLFSDMKSPEETAFYQDGSKVRFNTLYGNLMNSLQNADKSPTALKFAKADMADFVSRLTKQKISNLVWDDTTVKENLQNAYKYLKDTGVPPDMIKDVEKNKIIGKILSLASDPAQAYLAINELEKFVLTQPANKTTGNLPGVNDPGYLKGIQASMALGRGYDLPPVDLPKNDQQKPPSQAPKGSGGISTASVKLSKAKHPKLVEFEASSYFDGKNKGNALPKVDWLKFTPTPRSITQMPQVRL